MPRPLALVVLLVSAASSSAQGQARQLFDLVDGPGPLTLEWSDAQHPGAPWRTDTAYAAEEPLLRLRVRGTPEHAGTWLQLRGRVYASEAFLEAHPGAMYAGLHWTPPVSLKSLGFDVNGTMPSSVLPAQKLMAFLQQAWPAPAYHSEAVLAFCQPVLDPGAGALESVRVWSGAYSTWSEAALAYWSPLVAEGDPTVLDMRSFADALIHEQTLGALGGSLLDPAADNPAQLGFVLEIQVLAALGSASVPAEFPEEDDPEDPPPGLTGWPAPVLSTSLTYQFAGTRGLAVDPRAAGAPRAAQRP